MLEGKGGIVDELIGKIEDRTLPQDWDYDESVNKIKTLIYKWKNMTLELLQELWVARENLSKIGNPYRLIGEKSPIKTWNDYCEDINQKRNTVNCWLRKYDPLLDIIIKEEKEDARARELDDRSIVPYGKNIFIVSNKYQESRNDAYFYLSNGDIYPTLKRRSWFFHKETGAEFTLREYAHVQEFPDDYKFVGTYETIKDQIGNAVPPTMGKHIAQYLEGNTFGDLFAGAGGLSFGLEMANKKALWAIERSEKYARTYRANHSHVPIITKDIKQLDPNEFPWVDIIIGGPPCQSFSLSGKRLKDDPRGKLYGEFLRFVDAIKPNEFVMENVLPILKIETQIKGDFEKTGYYVQSYLIDGLEIGMRQRRKRVFFVGKRVNQKGRDRA